MFDLEKNICYNTLLKSFFKGCKMRFFLILSALAVFAFANPTPLGFEIDKATYQQVVSKYRTKTFNRSSSGGKSISVDSSNFELDGLTRDYVRFSFDAQDKLVYVSLTFNRNKYNELLSSLRQKYRLTKNTTNRQGEKFAEFESGNCIINLDGLDKVHLYYTSKDEIKRNISKEEEFMQRERERERRSKDNIKTLL